jgi:hypothetical protein
MTEKERKREREKERKREREYVEMRRSCSKIETKLLNEEKNIENKK